MSAEQTLERMLAALTPDGLRALVLALAEEQPADARSNVNLSTIMEALPGYADLGSGAEGWSAQLALKRALIAMLAQIPDLQFVEGDA